MLLTLATLTACHTPTAASGADDTVKATPSISGTVNAVSGGRTAVTIPFNASASKPLSDLSITSGLTSLPAGWTGPSTFNCATVTTDNGCVLDLMFAPTGDTAGTVTLSYSYLTPGGSTQTGSVSIPYKSTTSNNLVATPSVSGQVDATVNGGAQSVSVTFDSDDGNPASSLTLTTSLSALPPGWSTTVSSFTCASVSTGNGCQLPLTYQPTAAGSGTLVLNFSYLDNSGTAKTGTLSIPYSATTDNSIVASASPSGQIVAVAASGSQGVTITFTTDDGNPASALSVTSPLNALPDGWSASTQTFHCDAVSTGNGCQLALTYAPTAASGGTLLLTYAYTSGSGEAKTGTVGIPYAATAHDDVTATVSPSGQITAIAPTGSQSVQVTFDTDDGNTATALTLTTALASLPSGWSSTISGFSCSTVSTGNSCQLPLTFAPSVAATGTLALGYQYIDNAGTAKNGTVTIDYSGTVHNNITATVSPGSTLSTPSLTTTPVTVTFTSDDGNPITGFSITSGLSSLPTDWSSGATSLSCATVATGSGCQLSLTFSPQSVESGTVTLDYAYTDDAGSPQTGSVNISYSSLQQHVYIADYQNGVYECPIGSGGTLGTCSVTAGSGSTGITFNGSYAYISYFSSNAVDVCTANTNGSLSACQSAGGGGFDDPTGLSVQGSYLYAANGNGSNSVTMCAISGSYGTLSSCAATGPSGNADGLLVTSGYGYVPASFAIQICSLNVGGALTNCASSGISDQWGIVISGGYAYMAGTASGATVNVCTVGSDGSLSSCASSTVDSSSSAEARGVAVTGNLAFVNVETSPGGSYDVYVCQISAGDGSLSSCQVSNGGVSSFPNLWGIAVH